MLVPLLLGMSRVELMDCSPKEQLLSIPAWEQTGSATVCSTSGCLLQLLALNPHGYLQSVEWFDEHVNTMVKHKGFHFTSHCQNMVFI